MKLGEWEEIKGYTDMWGRKDTSMDEPLRIWGVLCSSHNSDFYFEGRKLKEFFDQEKGNELVGVEERKTLIDTLIQRIEKLEAFS